jgi:hypothetical protein
MSPHDFRSQRSHQNAPLFINASTFTFNVQLMLMLARFSLDSCPVFLRPNKVPEPKPRLPSDNAQPEDCAHKGRHPRINSQSPNSRKKRQCIKCIEKEQDQEYREQAPQPAWKLG